MSKKIYLFIKIFVLVWNIINRTENNQQGIGSPILVTKDNIVIDGNTRLTIAKSLHMTTVPVVRIDKEIEYVEPQELKQSY